MPSSEPTPDDDRFRPATRTNMPLVTRVVVVDHTPEGDGLAWEKRGLKDVMVSIQDGGHTLKVFVK